MFNKIIDEAVRLILPPGFYLTCKKEVLLDEILSHGVGDLESRNPLGDYSPMSSPGLIRLYTLPIGALVRGALCDPKLLQTVGYDLSLRHKICRLIVSQTYFHEQLHFMWDLAKNQKWPGAIHSKTRTEEEKEEALATAWAWYCSQAYGRQLGLPVAVIESVTRFCFDGIDLRGYKDWINWAHGCFFESEFARHFELEHFSHSPEPDPRDRLNDFLKLVVGSAERVNYKILTRKNGEEMASFVGDRGAFPKFINVKILRKAGTYYPFDSHCDLRKGSVASPNHIYERFPKSGEVSDLLLCYRKVIPSLQGIHKKLWYANRICLRHSKITGSILGLLKISKKTDENKPVEGAKVPDIFIDQPIQKALNKVDILSAQQDLIDEGREDLADPKI